MSRSLRLLSALAHGRHGRRDQRGLWRRPREQRRRHARPLLPAAATARGKAVRFAECMRAHGVTGVSVPGRVGQVDHRWGSERLVGGHELCGVRTGAQRVQEAGAGGFTGTKATPRQRRARLAFARCVRENGVPDFPDPTRNGPLVDTNRIPSSGTPEGMSALNAAMQKCGRYAAAAGVQASSEAL